MTHALKLVPINLHNDQEVQELLQQRRICGWTYLQHNIDQWRDMMDAGRKNMWWMTLPSEGNVRAGHISLASQSSPPHPDIARLDKSVMTISTFFTMPAYRGRGLGGEALDMVEELARKPPYGSEKCEALVIDTMRKEDETDELKALFARHGVEMPKSSEMFYIHRGWVKVKEEKRYEDSIPAVGPMNVKAAFLRRELH